MSEVMEQAVLRMPPHLWTDNPLDVMQRHARYVEAADELERLRAEVAALREDKDRLDFLDAECANGSAPAIVNDDAGHWAYSDSGMSPAVDDTPTEDWQIVVWVEPDMWRDNIRAAIDAARGAT